MVLGETYYRHKPISGGKDMEGKIPRAYGSVNTLTNLLARQDRSQYHFQIRAAL